MKFSLYLDPEIKKSERHFYLSFVKQEHEFARALPMMKQYIELTEHAYLSCDQAQLLFNDRVSLLDKIKLVIVRLTELLRESTKSTLISTALFVEHIKVTLAWGLNGVEGGPSGDEFLISHALDEFLGIPGDCGVYRASRRNRNAMPAVYRDLLESLKVGLDYRFNSFIEEVKDGVNPLMKAKDRLIKSLVTWRMMHAKRAKHFLRGCKATASMNLEDFTDTREKKMCRAGTQKTNKGNHGLH